MDKIRTVRLFRPLPWKEGCIFVGAVLLFVPFLGLVHLFDWDEVNFAEASREMLATGNYSIPQINYQPFWEKPPLFFWLQVLSMKVFGINEFAARFPNAVCGIITLLLVYRIGKKLVDEQFGWMWALVFAASFLPQFYFKSGIIDPWFNLFIFLSVYYLLLYYGPGQTHFKWRLGLSGLFAGLAMMTKGPVALLVIALCYLTYLVISRFRNRPRPLDLVWFILPALVVGSLWFLALYLNGQQQVIYEFFAYQVRLFSTGESGHGGPIYYHLPVLLFGCFPAAALAIPAMRKPGQGERLPAYFHQWMLILFWVVLLLFSIVRTKIIHYSSLCYFPLTYLGAVGWYRIANGKTRLTSFTRWLQVFTGLLFSVLFLAAALMAHWKDWFLKHVTIEDEFAKASLDAVSGDRMLELIPGLLLLAGVVPFLVYSKRKPAKACLFLLVASLLSFNLCILFITPKVERYSQGAAIEFYQSKQHEAALMETLDFKSYAQFFYGRRPPRLGNQVADSILRFNAYSEVPVYFVGKIQNREKNLQENKQLQLLYTKNGFVFFYWRR